MAKAPLPPGVSAQDFANAIREFKSVVGADWVFTTEQDLELYRDPYSHVWGTPEERLASAALSPTTVEQVQQIVRIANKYKTPLFPVSAGRNLAYGAAAPVMSGSVVLDLKRMNKVLAVDDKRHFALVEPGVTYFDLYRHIQERKLKVWIDVANPGWGSLVGNALDHGIGHTYSPYRDHFGSHCGMEVVLPNGELMRTGMGAMPNADTWQDMKYGQGAGVEGLFAQSGFGIVTKMGFWLAPQPEAVLTARVQVPRYGDLQALIEEFDCIENSGLSGPPGFSSPLAAPGPDLTALMAEGWPSLQQIEAYHAKRGGPAWTLSARFYGPEETIRGTWSYAKRRIGAAISGATFEETAFYRAPHTLESIGKENASFFGLPNLDTFYALRRRPDDKPDEQLDGHIDFWATVPRTAAGLHAGHRMVYETQRQVGMPVVATPFGGPVIFFARSFMVGFSIVTYRTRPEKNRKAMEYYTALIKNAGAAGFGMYRANISSQDLSAEQYSFNNHSLQRFRELLKDAADPNGIISPGRYGLWPARLRQTKGRA